jgi:hypothetical protein
MLGGWGWALPKSGLCSDPPHEVLIPLKPSPLGFTLHLTNHSVLFMGWEGEGGDMGNCPLLIFHASFFLFGWRGGGGWSKETALKFLTCSFLKSSQEHLTSSPYSLTNVVLISPIQTGPKGRNSILQNKTFYFE